MAQRTIKVSKRFAKRVQEIAVWYAAEVDSLAARHFLDDLQASMDAVATFPAIGVPESVASAKGRQYRSFSIHPRFRIVYRYTTRTIYFAALRSTLMNGE